jgi:hypothetical protein
MRLGALNRANLYPRKYCCYDLSRDYATVNTGKRNSCHMKTNFVSYLFFYAEFKYVSRISPSPTVFCDIIFYVAILANLVFLLCYRYVLNMAEALYYILNIVW